MAWNVYNWVRIKFEGFTQVLILFETISRHRMCSQVTELSCKYHQHFLVIPTEK